MKKKLLFKVLLVTFPILLLFSCKKENIEFTNDETLKNKIVGKWIIPNYRSITYYDDNSFIDSSLAKFNDSDEYQAHTVIKGRFSINSNKLILRSLELTYVKGEDDNNLLGHISDFTPNYEIEIIGDTMYSRELMIFSPLENNGHINGKWTTKEVFAAYYSDSSINHFGGHVDLQYDIESESNTINIRKSYITNNSIFEENNENLNYEYESGIINTIYGNSGYNKNYSVSFEAENMIWKYINKKTYFRQ